jgi:hypothetical protein
MSNKNEKNIEKELQFLIYTSPEEDVKVKAFVKDDTIWLNQRAMGELFGVQAPAISKHLKNIFDTGELDEKVVVSILEIPTPHGAMKDKMQNSETNFYSLDAIIAVGYRVNSKRATNFRIWATQVLKEFIQKGFVLNDERLKQGERVFGKDFFRELLERVRSIRASERRIWQQITDIFAECSIDYEKDSDTTKEFYATVQNKFHYAITGQTAAEIVYTKADSNKDYMGLTTWKNAPDGRILKGDVVIAKNYLEEKQIKQLEREVSGFFDYIERELEQEVAFNMQDFAKSVNAFLSFHKYEVLNNKGRISHEDAVIKAESEYDIFNKKQIIVSDFDELVKATKQDKKDGGNND